MKINLITLFIFVLTTTVVSSQESLSSYHLGDLQTTYKYNPAEHPDSRLVISSIPYGIVAGVKGYQEYSMSELITKNGDQYLLDISKVKGLFRNNPQQLSIDGSIDWLYLGINENLKSIYYRGFINTKFDANLFVPNKVIDFLSGWGGKNLDKEFSDNINYNYQVYTEFGFGMAKDYIYTGWRIGADIKYLMGHYYGNSGNTKISFKSNSKDYSIMMSLQDADLIGDLRYLYGNNKINTNIVKGHGTALDLGVSYDMKYNHDIPLTLKMSITDIGFIAWSGLTNYRTQENKIIVVSKPDDFSKITDLLEESIIKDDRSTVSLIPIKGIFSMDYTLTKNHAFKFTTLNKIIGKEIYNYMALGYTLYTWKNKIGITLNGTKYPGATFSYGIGTRIRLGVVQLHLATDTMTTITSLYNARAINVVGGITLNFKYKDKKLIQSDYFEYK